KYFQQLKQVWDESKKLAAVKNVDEQAAWKRFQTRISQSKDLRPVTKKNFTWLRVAALFVLAAGSLLAYLLMKDRPAVQQVAVRTFDKVMVDTLSDGSVITLNKNSSIHYPEKFIGGKRVVQLDGEAFFDVKPDAEQPFEVIVNDITVRVVGTSFNIRSENGQTEVIVETGLVKVSRNNNEVALRPGEKLVIKASDTLMSPQQETDRLYNYYRSREFVCDDTPLWKLVEVLNEAYDTTIVIERAELRNLPLTVTFSNESLETILEIIRETFNTYQIRIVKTEDKIILR
ncbi:MAG TPA: FecR domain-containing protein, partial [Chitinophagaceae bacterium]|nr:FecR domain-containing protein [Chitinophagaceae bacterium]